MLKKMNVFILSILLTATFCVSAFSLQAQQFSPLPDIYKPSATYRLTVSGQSVPIVAYTDKYDYAHFILNNQEAAAELELCQGQIESYSISPRKLGIASRLEENRLHFKILKGQYLIVKLNNERALVITTDSKAQDSPPSNGPGIFNVQDLSYGADPTGRKSSGHAIQRAINDAAAYGKGTVFIPRGVYATGTLELKSNLNIFLEIGAVLLFSASGNDHRIDARKISQNRDLTRWIYTRAGSKNIKIFGSGTIDGNGKYAVQQMNLGNHILSIIDATNVEINGLIIRDSGSWAILPARSKNVRLYNLKVFNRFDMGENDGIDVIESQHVRIRHVIAIGLDDPFSTKTWAAGTDICKDWPKQPRPLKDVTFEDCISWTYCYGFKVGQGVLQPQADIRFRNSVVYDAAVGIGIHHKWGRATVRNVHFENIDIERLSYQNDDHRTWAVFLMQNGDKQGSGAIRQIQVRDITVRDAGKSPVKISGWNQQHQISRLEFRNIRMPGKTLPATCLKDLNVNNISFADHVSVHSR